MMDEKQTNEETVVEPEAPQTDAPAEGFEGVSVSETDVDADRSQPGITVSPDAALASAPVELAPGQPVMSHDDEDVQFALDRETEDGSGFKSADELPDEDFESFAEGDVENDAPVDEVSS